MIYGRPKSDKSWMRRKWFAWYPVRLHDGRKAWLQEVSCLARDTGEGDVVWFYFETEVDLLAFIRWIEPPPAPEGDKV